MGLCSPAECNCVVNVLDTDDIDFSRSGSGSVADPIVISGELASTEWASYTPTLTQSGAVTKTVTDARWVQLGRLVIVTFNLSVTGSGTGSNSIVLGLPPPVPVVVDNIPCGAGYMRDASGGSIYSAQCVIVSTTTFELWSSAVDAAAKALGAGGSPVTFGLASGDDLRGSFMYEATS